MTAPRWVVNILAALVLAGLLGYLYRKTEATDFRRHTQVMADLAKLKDIDSRWNLAVLQARLVPGTREQLIGSPRLARETAAELAAAVEGSGEQEILMVIAKLQQELETKSGLMERLRSAPPADAAVIADQALLVPTGSRIDTLATLFDLRFQHLLDEQELYRTYLFYYSAALLVLVAWVGSRLLASYKLLADANRALREANGGLERRVEERTRELTDALMNLKESETLLIQSEKMSSLGQMVAGIAHEINTPLAYVKSSLQSVHEELPQVRELVSECDRLLVMLDSGENGEEQLAAQFARAAAAAERFRAQETVEGLDKLLADGLHGIQEISELVLSLKNFSRLDRSKVARFNLNEGLESALVIARNLLKHRQVVKRYGNIPLITCWPSQVNQVFLNLVTNAAQATPEEGGVITLTTRREGDAQVSVEVQDNGHGIPEDVLPRVFDPFFTTKEVGGGTGLGLAIAYKIAEQHGGSIRVASRVGVGTRFTVILPLEPPAAPAPEK
ncbi:MAG TPA: ATP-binding protein [Burkholderiales bacterium]|nr:ATP-binding protein [Burkholderiales bacterium]